MKSGYILLLLAWLLTPTGKIIAVISVLAPLAASYTLWATRNPVAAVGVAVSVAIVLKAFGGMVVNILAAIQQLLIGKPVTGGRSAGSPSPKAAKTGMPKAPSAQQAEQMLNRLTMRHAQALEEVEEQRRRERKLAQEQEQRRLYEWARAQGV